MKQLGLWMICLMVLAITLCGQTSGTINGTVRDASGALVPGARIDARSNTSAFVRAGNLWGDSGRNILRGPIQRNLDVSVNKRFAITERVAAEWRTEFFNMLNIANFANPGGSITAVSYGVIRNTTGNPRVVQLAVKLVF